MSTSKRTGPIRLPIEMRGRIGSKEADDVADGLTGLAVVDGVVQPEDTTPVRVRDADDLADEVNRLSVTRVSIPGLLHLGVGPPVSIKTFADVPPNMFLYIFRTLQKSGRKRSSISCHPKGSRSVKMHSTSCSARFRPSGEPYEKWKKMAHERLNSSSG